MNINRINNKMQLLIESEAINEITTGGFLAYHGSPKKIERFTDEFVGGEDANDEEGAGIYFTTEHEDAAVYGSFIYHVRIGGSRFLDDKHPASDVDFTELLELIKMADEWEMEAQNWSEDPESGAQQSAQSAIDYSDNEKEVFLQVWHDFYRYDSVNYVRNMVKLGYDGLIVNRYKQEDMAGKHIIVYNPDIIEVLKVEEINHEKH